MSHDSEKAVNLKLPLYPFEMMSYLKINYLKSETFPIRADNMVTSFYSDMFGCDVACLPMKYLVFLLVYMLLLKLMIGISWKEKWLKKVDAWKGNASFGGRFILVSASLSAVPSFVMSMFLFNKTILGRLDKRRRRFFWHTGSLKKKNHMVKRKVICRSKNKGGLGVLDLGKQYITFLTK